MSNELDDFLKLIAEAKEQDPKYQQIKQVKQNVQSDLGSLFEQLGTAVAEDPKKRLIDSVKQNVKTDLNSLFEQLNSATFEPIIEESAEQKIDELVQEIQTIEAVEATLEESKQEPKTPEERQDSVEQYIKSLPKNSHPFQQPEVDTTKRDLKAVTDKLKFLEQWVAKISAAGPGGGEVNLRWLDDVDRSTIQDGYFLKYNASKKKFEFVEIKAETALQDTGEPMGHQNILESQISFDNTSRTFTISPRSVSYVVYTRGTKRVISDIRSVTIPDQTGLYYIYFDINGVLRYRTTVFDWANDCMTAYIYWNADIHQASFVADERHGITLDWQTHEYLHRTRGSAYANGFTASNYILNGDGSLNSHLQFDLAGGTFFDEDLQVDIVSSNTPTLNSWEQDLSTPTRIPVFYKMNDAWVIDTPTSFAVKQGTVRPCYNVNTDGVWSVADIDNNKFGVAFILATNNINYPVIAIMGQTQRANQADADAYEYSNLDLTGFPVFELRVLYKFVFDTKSAYTNTPKARFTSIVDLRKSQII